MQAVEGLDLADAANAIGLSDEWVRQRRAGIPIERMKGPTRRILQTFISSQINDQPEYVGKLVKFSPMKLKTPYYARGASGFAEHVLYTAGRIAELAEQLSRAAARHADSLLDREERSDGSVSPLSLSAIEDGARVMSAGKKKAAKKKRA